jgi:hypothetical protein
VRTFEQGKIPQVGSVIELECDDSDEPMMSVRCVKSFGVAEVIGVRDRDGTDAIIAFYPDGRWVFVRRFEKKDPWAGDPDEWRKQADG